VSYTTTDIWLQLVIKSIIYSYLSFPQKVMLGLSLQMSMKLASEICLYMQHQILFVYMCGSQTNTINQ